MFVIINGETKKIKQGLNVASLIAELGMQGKRIAVELNEEILPASDYAHTELFENDRLEIVHAIGGG